MLKNIKSKYIVEKIFIHIYEERKLKIIKCNKKIQTQININLDNFKKTSKRYIIYGDNGEGKEFYNDGKLLFEGEYLNGKRNGKGKEYYHEYYHNKLLYKEEDEDLYDYKDNYSFRFGK